MLSTAVIVSVVLILLCTSFFLWAAFLCLGARWAKIPGVTLRRALFVALVASVVQTVISVLMRSISPATDAQALAIAVLDLGLTLFVPFWLIATILKARFLRAVQAWLPTLVPSIAMLLVVYFVIVPFVAEAFRTPTSSMAPTLLGRHWKDTCPICGSHAYCSADERPDRLSTRPAQDQLMICADNFHTSRILPSSTEVHGEDRFLVSKFLTPRRWDVVVFRYPEDPTTLHVQRLVGLPGEEVYVKDGAVWIDGKPIAPPESIEGLTYVSELDGRPMEMWGTPENPAKLGADEYFMLGDFSHRARDSRLWNKGAPGHPPYAVPASYLHGVVTHIVWPPSRWRILR